MKTKYATHQTSPKIVWIALALLLSLTSCSLPGANSEPTAIVYPTAVVVPTSPPSPPTLPPPPTVVPTPKAEISATLTEILIDEWTEIEYKITDADGISLVQLTLNGEMLDSDDHADEHVQGMETKFPWSTFEPGEYTFSLIGYDFNDRPSDPATLTVTVLPLVSAEVFSVSENAIVGKLVTIELSVESNAGTGFSSVELTLNSPEGEYIFFDRADNLKTETEKIGYTVEWTPNKSGEFTLYLTAYDLHGRPSGSDTVIIMVSPAP